jgi:hypothetical protein
MTLAAVRAPYITPYSEESIDFDLVLARHDGAADRRRLSYPEPADDDWLLGVLWARQEDHRRGDPLFNQVHIRRQRECMLGQLCQVCKRTAWDPAAGRLWWVFPREVPAADMYLTKPPACVGCVGTAISACPLLRGDYEPYGVLGDVFSLSGGQVRIERGQDVPLDAFRTLEYTLARALTVHVQDMRREPAP